MLALIAIPGIAVLFIPGIVLEVASDVGICAITVLFIYGIVQEVAPGLFTQGVPDIEPDGVVVCWLEPQAAKKTKKANRPNRVQRSMRSILS